MRAARAVCTKNGFGSVADQSPKRIERPKDDRSILQYQLIQHEPARFELRLATLDAAAFPPARERAITALRALLGPESTIEAAWHEDLGRSERERTGKFRAVESRLADR